MSTLPPRSLPRRLLGWPGAGADLVLLVALASVVTVVSLWLTGGGVQEMAMGSGTGAALTSLGRLAGLVASDLLLLQVVAMARIPWVETTGRAGPAGALAPHRRLQRVQPGGRSRR